MNHTHAHLSIRGHWIDGTVVDGSLPATDIRNPATGEVVTGVPTGTADDVDRAVAAARAALPVWAATPPPARADILRRLSAILSARTAEIAEAVTAEMGAPVTLARAGHVGRIEGLEVGAFIRPTIFTDVDPASTIAQEEIFGPVLSVIAYDTEDEAVSIANGTSYGLTAAVFGEPTHAQAVARRLNVGQVYLNGADFNPIVPFGGLKQSGTGRELGRAGVEEFTETVAMLS